MDYLTSTEYVLARRVLLDALEALAPHLDALVLVGAQAVYLHVGEADFAVAPTTTDADTVLAPERLRDEPLLEVALKRAGFCLGDNPGTWKGGLGVAVDLMVPEALSGSNGRRGARLAVHGNRVARRTLGLEAALIDNAAHRLVALETTDHRAFRLRVAGPAALLVSKVTKVGERQNQPRRLKSKDALDILRLLLAIDTSQLAATLKLLAEEPLSRAVTVAAMDTLDLIGSSPNGLLADLAAQAVGVLEDHDTVRQSLAVLVEMLLSAYGGARDRPQPP